MASWTSALEQSDRLELEAPKSAAWMEVWRLELGPVWHVEPEGIPPVHQEPGPGARTREWRPWPGEKVTLAISRPAGVPGRTLTLDRALRLPEGAELQSVSMDGELLPVRQEGAVVTLPIQPGSHAAEVSWRQPGGIRLLYSTPRVGLGASAVNAELSIAMPADRWRLFVGGPKLGPAVLFWSLLGVYGLVSVALGRLGLTPLETPLALSI